MSDSVYKVIEVVGTSSKSREAAAAAAVSALTIFELRGEWRRLHRMPPPMRLSRDLLTRGITYKLQRWRTGLTLLLPVFPCYVRKNRQFSPLLDRPPVNIFSSSVDFSVGYGVFPSLQELRAFLRKTGIFS